MVKVCRGCVECRMMLSGNSEAHLDSLLVFHKLSKYHKNQVSIRNAIAVKNKEKIEEHCKKAKESGEKVIPSNEDKEAIEKELQKNADFLDGELYEL